MQLFQTWVGLLQSWHNHSRASPGVQGCLWSPQDQNGVGHRHWKWPEYVECWLLLRPRLLCMHDPESIWLSSEDCLSCSYSACYWDLFSCEVIHPIKCRHLYRLSIACKLFGGSLPFHSKQIFDAQYMLPELLFCWLHVSSVKGPSHSQSHASSLVLLGEPLYCVTAIYASWDRVVPRAEIISNCHSIFFTHLFSCSLAKLLRLYKITWSIFSKFELLQTGLWNNR